MTKSLLDLPTELRLHIYETLFSSFESLDPLNVSLLDASNVILQDECDTRKSYSVLFTSQQIFLEIRTIVVQTHTLLVTDLPALESVLRKHTRLMSHTTSIQTEVEDCDHTSITHTLHLLSNLPSLQSIGMRISAAKIDADKICIPVSSPFPSLKDLYVYDPGLDCRQEDVAPVSDDEEEPERRRSGDALSGRSDLPLSKLWDDLRMQHVEIARLKWSIKELERMLKDLRHTTAAEKVDAINRRLMRDLLKRRLQRYTCVESSN